MALRGSGLLSMTDFEYVVDRVLTQIDGRVALDDVRALLAPRARKLAGAIAGRALYDGRLDAAAALALIATARS